MYGGLKRSKYNKHVSYFWIARKCLGLCDNHVKYTTQVIQDHIRKVHEVNISYKKAWMTKNILHELCLGNFEKSYKLSSTYSKELVRSNPRTIFKLIADQDVFHWREGLS